MLDVRRGLVVVSCVCVGFIISAGPGLVARAAEPDRWISALTPETSTTATPEGPAQRRIAELERRVKELEAERGGAQRGADKSRELAAARAGNDELAARNLALSVENQSLVQRLALEHAAGAACAPPSDTDPRAQIRYWARQLRDGESTYGWVPPEWTGALNVLLRRERQLDPHNPWREP